MNLLRVLVCLMLPLNAWSVKLSDYHPYKFEVLFTNPECQEYRYATPMILGDGRTVQGKPKNVYCKKSDENTSVSRAHSPQYRLVEWIKANDTKEISLAYLSFSSANVTQALCEAASHGKKITIILDGGKDSLNNPELNKSAESIKKCGGDVHVFYRGNTRALGYAHNKLMFVKTSSNVRKIVFSSGNMTTGTSINHENWNFVTTSENAYFSQTHVCLLEGMILAGDSKANFSNFINSCRAKIKNSPESDIQVFFSPTDGAAALNTVVKAAEMSDLVEGMSHRLSGKIAELVQNLVLNKKQVRFILDDDVYWAMMRRQDVGRNTSFESFKIFRDLINNGMNTKFLETNQNIFQLQHNKFLIFTAGKTGAVFTGAGNLTTAAFTKNHENFYFITIPEVVKSYNDQYDLYFDKMSTSINGMPRNYELP